MKTFYDTEMQVIGHATIDLGLTREYARGDLIKVMGHHYLVMKVSWTPAAAPGGRPVQVVQVVSDPDWS